MSFIVATYTPEHLEVMVYPNPNNGQFFVQLEQMASETEVMVYLYDLMGIRVYGQQFETAALGNEIEIQAPNRGSYVLEVVTGSGKRWVQHVIVHR